MKVEKGLDGGLFLVFASELDAAEYCTWLESITGSSFKFACFNGFFNALELPMVEDWDELFPEDDDEA